MSTEKTWHPFVAFGSTTMIEVTMQIGGESTEFMANSLEAEIEPNRNSKRRFVAAVASSILPGSGQWLLGARFKALAYFAWISVVAVLYWPVRLPKTYWGLIFLAWFMLFLFVLSTWDSLRGWNPNLAARSRWWLLLFVPLAILGSAFHSNWLLRASGFRSYSIPTSSMEITIRKGDAFVADLRAYHHATPGPYEVIVFRRDKAPYVKRVIAGSGSMIVGKSGAVIVNGKQLSEPYVQHTGQPLPQHDDFGPMLIPAGKLFVMGDNRDVSYDSRIPDFGLVDVADVLGKPLYIYRSAKGWVRTDIH